MTARGGTWRWPGARRRSTAITVVTRMALGVLRVGRSFVTARISPGIEVGHRIHNAPTELTKLRPSADHALLLQRARRQPQVIGGFIVGDRKSVVEGRSVSVRVDFGGGRSIKKKKKQTK